ncbi:MAG: hypothetical protein AB1346_01635, partial [Thermodesulfobacteriota bacterium]
MKTTVERRSMEADGWDQHVARTYSGVDDTCMDELAGAVEVPPAPTEPIPSDSSAGPELLVLLR